jgi:uncharacterized protein (DUF1810 family)
MATTCGQDPYDLDRFVRAQAVNYDEALAELRAGRKRTHWSWYVLPQLRGLGSSPMSMRYGVCGLAEARAYLAHPVLGARLRECVAAIVAHADSSATDILGSVDARKLHSCLTLFDRAAPDGDSSFRAALDVFFAGVPDPATLAILSSPAGSR